MCNSARLDGNLDEGWRGQLLRRPQRSCEGESEWRNLQSRANPTSNSRIPITCLFIEDLSERLFVNECPMIGCQQSLIVVTCLCLKLGSSLTTNLMKTSSKKMHGGIGRRSHNKLRINRLWEIFKKKCRLIESGRS